MKNTFALLSLAAGLSQVAATGYGWNSAPKFSCPDNTDNKCTDKQKGGFTFDDLDTGDFSKYGGFNWKGFSCSSGFGKRGLNGRTVNKKCITGTAGSNKGSSPSFGCDKSSGVDKTSVKEFHVFPEFDCDLEFHYNMPDGSTCKHRSSCSSKGSVVKNSQCGGATDVTIVYPPQPNKPKPSCSFAVPSISFGCDTASTTKTISTYSVSSTSKVTVPTTSTKPQTSTYPVTSPSIPVSTPSKPVSTPSVPVSTPKTSEASTTTKPTVPGSSSYPVETPSKPVTTPVTTPSVPVSVPSSTVTIGNSTIIKSSSSTSPAQSIPTTYPVESTPVTTPGQSTPVTSPVQSSPVSSPVVSTPATSPVSTPITQVTSYLTTVSTPGEKPTTKTAEVPSTVVAPSSSVGAPTSSKPAGPVETLPCPGVVPSCLSTWMFTVGCKDNTDTACYCPDTLFVQNVFSCMYSYGESDAIISEAINYFQGICAPHVPQNPAIATGAATVTTYLTVTAAPTPAPSAVYTTINVDVTTVIPCTTTGGATIPSSSTTVVISTQMTVPQVGFTTVPGGASGSSSVAVIPGTYSAVPVPGPTGPAAPTTPGSGAPAPYPTAPATTLVTAKPTGTGAITSKPATTTFATAGAAQMGAGLGFLGFAAMALAL